MGGAPAADVIGAVKKLNPTQHLQMTWPDDYMEVGADDQLIAGGGSVGEDDELHASNVYGGRKKRILFRPQVTVNVFSTGGSSAGGSGSGAGGSGTGGAASVNTGGGGGGGGYGGGGGGDPYDIVSALTTQLAALSKKVDELSILAAAPRGPPVVLDSGNWNTSSVRPYTKPQLATSARINFAKTFKKAPTVRVAMNLVDVDKGQNFRVKVYASGIDAKGFTIHADAWSNTILYSAAATWLAIGE